MISVDVAEMRLQVESQVQKGGGSQYFLDYDYLISTAPQDSLLKMINDTDPVPTSWELDLMDNPLSS